MAIGATHARIMTMVLGQGMLPAVWGVVAGLVLSIVTARFMDRLVPFAHHVGPSTYYIVVPLLTVIADVVGIIGGWTVSIVLYGLPSSMFSNSVRDGITTDDIAGGVIKPLVFAFLMGTIACHKGLKTEGGTVGVGRSTTAAVVLASIVVIIADFFLAKALQVILGTQ